MPSRCVLILDNVSLIRPALCTRRITCLSPEKTQAVCEALVVASGC